MNRRDADRILNMSAGGCIFCEIVAGESPASIVHQDNMLLGLRDIQPVSRGRSTTR